MRVAGEAETAISGDGSPVDVDATLTALEESLGHFCYRWLIACAAFPGLRLPITLHLGAALKRADGEPPPSEEDVLALASLPWFRQGWIPDGWRRVLLARQSERDRATVRNALADLMYSMVDANNADARGGVTVARVAQAPRNFAQDWAEWRDGLPSALSRPDPALETVVAPRDASRRDVLVLGIGAALGAVGLAGGWWGRSYLNPEVRPQVLEHSTNLAVLDPTGSLAAIARADASVTVASTERPDRIWSMASSTPALALGFKGQAVILVTADRIYTWCPSCSVPGVSPAASVPSKRLVNARVASNGNTVVCLAADGPGRFEISMLRGNSLVSLQTIRSDSEPRLAVSPTGQFAAVTAVAVSPAAQVAAAATDNRILLVDFGGKSLVTSIPATAATNLAIGEDASGAALIAYADGKGTVVAGSSRERTFSAFDPGIGRLEFLAVQGAPSGVAPLIIAGAEDGRIAVQARDRVLLTGHSGAIRTACFDDDLTLLASGSDDGTARLWRLSDGANIVLPAGAPVLHVAFVPKEQLLVTLSADGVARRWRADEFATSGTKGA